MLHLLRGSQIYILIASLFLLFCTNVTAAPLRVAIVHSYHPNFAWTEGVEQGFLKRLGQFYEYKVVGISYLDSKRAPESKEAKARDIVKMLKVSQFDVLFVSDDDAFELVARSFFASSSVVIFCGVNNPLTEYGSADMAVNNAIPANVGGVREVYQIVPLFRLIKDIVPAATHLILLFDESLTARGVRKRIQNEIGADNTLSGFQIKQIVISNHAEQWQRAIDGAVPNRDVLVIFPFSEVRSRSQHDHVEPKELARWIVSRSRVPEFASASLSMNFGFFAMAGIDAKEHGADAADSLLKIMKKSNLETRVVNKSYARLSINVERAAKLGVKIPFDVLAYSYALLNGL